MEQEIFFADDQEPRLAENDVHIEISVIDDIYFENMEVEEVPPEVQFFYFYCMTLSFEGPRYQTWYTPPNPLC